MDATKEQKKQIRANCGYDVSIKEEFVQWATGDNNKTSLDDLSFEQAEQILRRQTGQDDVAVPSENWAWFDKNNKRHLFILSLCRQAQWTTTHPTTHKEVVDLDRLSNWLKSEKSPVRKKLSLMQPDELKKIVQALRGIVKSIYR